MTRWQKDPYWYVDLEGDFEITVIKLHLNERKLNRMTRFKLHILDGEVEVWEYKYRGEPASPTIVIDVPETAAAGNKVKISLTGRTRTVELKEVEVMAHA